MEELKVKYEHKRQLTRDKIEGALIKVAKNKGIADVTVSDIIKTANINRSTFYRHYIDKPDLIDSIEDRVISDIKEANVELKSTELEHINTAAGKFVYKFLTVIEENQPILELLLSEKGDIRFTLKLIAFFNKMVASTTEVFTDTMDEKKRKLFAAYNSSTAMGVVTFWVHHFDEYDKDYVYDFLMHRGY